MRPLKYGEKLISVPTRVPESAVEDFKVMTNEFLSKLVVIGGEKPKAVVETKVKETAKPKWQIDAEERMKRNKG